MTFFKFLDILEAGNFIYRENIMPEKDNIPEVRTELPETNAQAEIAETAQTPEKQATIKAPEQEIAEQANKKATAEVLAKQEKDIKEAALVKQTQTETQEVLTDDQKAKEVSRRLEELSKTIQPTSEGNIILTTEQLRELDMIESLITQSQPLSSLPPIPRRYETYLTREDLVDGISIKEARKRIEKRLKEEKKSEKELDKLLISYEKLLNQQNSNNYEIQKASVL